jgi:molybdate transport system ATP-binding protein
VTSDLTAELVLRAGALEIELALAVDERGLILVGPNGAGKTTTLLALVGARRAVRGRVAIGDDILFDGSAGIDRPPEERGLAYLPQDYALFPHLDATANVAFGIEGRPRERKERARELLERLGIGAVASRRPAALSGGEQQRVALARALAASPRALLLDEPLAALDVGARAEVRVFLANELRTLGLPFIIVTHDRDDIRAFSAPIMVLENGRALQLGEAGELERAPASPFVARLFGRG